MKLKVSVSGLFIALALQSSALFAASLTINISNQQQQPLADAVVELRSLTNPELKPQRIQVAQQQLTFVPFVSAIPAGSEVEFPNLDKTRHHVYSFSPAKQFEIKLYADKPEAPIIFDTPGIIALGCNIHDYMQAYIYVSESNLVAVSDGSGKLTWPDIAPGSYQLYLWHPWQLEPRQPAVLDVVMPVQSAAYQLDIDLSQQKPQPPQRGFGSR
ncbi:methylamine utilization protein [Arsukibacterium indicum]|uniref:Methylamine utilization protein n=1 Tax=Arsukibacterium indicum TaxID=2848612 RepID=A0ABS6MKY7_9GAMM|nr:methylamine utilization protein [Arsukibacterium indicum]MBV2129034.1 methylamine utilization protein [Arsukibacterium indicum]